METLVILVREFPYLSTRKSTCRNIKLEIIYLLTLQVIVGLLFTIHPLHLMSVSNGGRNFIRLCQLEYRKSRI